MHVNFTVNFLSKERMYFKMTNLPKMKIGIVAVSRDCFPESLSVTRRQNLVKAYTDKYDAEDIYECPVCIVESEIHMVQALEDIKKAGCNALVVYLGNFGPEISETLLAKHFDGPKMFVAASEEDGLNGGLIDNRGDAYCGMLNASYNLKLRNVKAYIPEYPVGTAEECADMIHEFVPIARTIYALSNLKIISFGPRPQNFLACNAPIKQLYNLDIEIEENSELDLFEAFNNHAGDKRIPDVVKDMEAELGAGNKFIWYGTGGNDPEGPHIYKINGWYYLLISEGGTEFCHMITVARSRNIWGEYESCSRNPVFSNRSTSLPIKGTGHMDIVCDQYGDWWGVCLANRPITYPFKHNLGRETFLVPVEWDDKGWPVIGRNGLLDERISSDRKLFDGVMQKSQTDEGKHFHDEFDGDALKKDWNFIYNTTSKYAVLDKTKVKKTFGITVPYWKDSLVKCIEELKQK